MEEEQSFIIFINIGWGKIIGGFRRTTAQWKRDLNHNPKNKVLEKNNYIYIYIVLSYFKKLLQCFLFELYKQMFKNDPMSKCIDYIYIII